MIHGPAKIMADERRPVMVTSAPITEDLPRLLKVIFLDSRTLQTPQQSRLTPLHPRVPSRGPPPHLQGNSSGLTHATNVAAVPTHPPAPSSAHGPGLASTAPTMQYGPAFSAHTNPNARHPGTFQVQPSPTPCRPEDSAAYHCLRHHITDTPPQLTPTHR